MVAPLRKGVELTPQSNPAKVAVFALGGTIASSLAEPGARGITPRLGVAELLATIPRLASIAEVTAVDFRRMPSCDLTFTDLAELGRALLGAFDEGCQGAVVIQGTDTLEETAFALDLLLSGRGPVIVTGAMRSPRDVGPDGPANILASVLVAASPSSNGLGALVVMNDEIHAARFVRKTNSTSPSAFASPSAGPLGWVSEGNVRWATRVGPLASVGVPNPDRLAPVALMRCTLGEDARVVDQLVGLGFAGLIVEGFGAGHVPARMVPTLERLATRIPVVLASRTGAGEVLSSTYGYPGSETDLLSRGIISAGALDGVKARVALTLSLASHSSVADAAEAFKGLVASVTR